tara:strand:- start:260 stop:469 length:210 start_codon:yes stop_codon:yes gene_type:complete
MEWSQWHDASQSWADPSLPQLRKIMRHVFEQRETNALKEKGVLARQTIYDRYNLYAVAKKIKDALEEVV